MLALIGVLIGGALTIGGQLMLSFLDRRREIRLKAQRVATICRLQQDSFWSYQMVGAEALRRGLWDPAVLPSRYVITNEDYRELAEAVPSDVWYAYTSALRRQDRTLIDSEVTLQDLLIACLFTDRARRKLHDFSGRDVAAPYRIGKIALTADEMHQLAHSESIVGRADLEDALAQIEPA